VFFVTDLNPYFPSKPNSDIDVGIFSTPHNKNLKGKKKKKAKTYLSTQLKMPHFSLSLSAPSLCPTAREHRHGISVFLPLDMQLRQQLGHAILQL